MCCKHFDYPSWIFIARNYAGKQVLLIMLYPAETGISAISHWGGWPSVISADMPISAVI